MDRPWFVGVRGPMRYSITLCAWQGWAMTAGYAVALLGVAVAVGPLDHQAPREIAALIALAVGLTGLFVFVAVRRSVPLDRETGVLARRGAVPSTSATAAASGYWFVPRRVGLGATPVTWQGWAVTVCGVGLALAVLAAVPSDLAKALLVAADIAAMTVLAVVKTDGAWRWRSSFDD